MPTVQECEAALGVLANRLSDVDPELRERHALDRTISCYLVDLDTDFSGRIVSGDLVDLQQLDDPDAQIRISLTSDDLLALTAGELHVASAWASGRVKIVASVFDLLKLRALL